MLARLHDLVNTAFGGQQVQFPARVLPKTGDASTRTQCRPFALIRGASAREPKASDPAATEVRVEVGALESGNRRAPIDVATGDRAAIRMIVIEDRAGEPGPIAGIGRIGGIAVGSLHPVPAEVDTAAGAASR